MCECFHGRWEREEMAILSTCRQILQWMEVVFEICGARLGYNCQEPGPGSYNVAQSCGLKKLEHGHTDGKDERDIW